jgi:dihydroorotate dehydrogenase (NAD+) catalytic subunit
MPASGTYGVGLELAAYGDPSLLGALVTKSLSVEPWAGNPPPRLRPLTAGSMLNSVGLQNPGVAAWASATLPRLRERGVTVVTSLWGHTPAELLAAAEHLATVTGPVAWEINLSCPNLASSRDLPSHNPDAAHAVCQKVRSLADAPVGLWAKLAPNAPDVAAVAAACQEAGMDAVTLTNTYPVRELPAATLSGLGRLPTLGGVGGGVSGAVLKPIVTQIVAAVRERCPDLAIVAAGGVLSAADALDYLELGATAVQVGTANFLDPRATHRIAAGVVAAMQSRQG